MSKRREFVELGKPYIPSKHLIGGWLWSEKLDGQRGIWDGGVTVGMDVVDVPWANTEKDGRLRDGSGVSTGLWSRLGKTIRAPEGWVEELQQRASGAILDGELWMGRGKWETMRSIVSRMDGSTAAEWNGVGFHWFGMPTARQLFADGEVKSTGFRKVIDSEKCLRLYKGLEMRKEPVSGGLLRAVQQKKLPNGQADAKAEVERQLQEVIDGGGEGLMLRCPGIVWEPKRHEFLLKVKGQETGEGVVVGWTWGVLEKREHGVVVEGRSKIAGKMGNVVVRAALSDGEESVQFELSGFTDEEREMVYSPGAVIGDGTKVDPKQAVSHRFPIGSKIKFKYRELSGDGIPKEARYLR